ncbi:MAG: fumarylacetoacetate hydrolase family protein [Rhodospirillales bacterium]|nr:fumarylacetoacetate hydrolase family protein [Rhodospirillales bacterium]
MSAFDPAPAAAALFAARGQGGILPVLDPAIAPRTEAEGAAAQRALAALMGADPPAGFKIGATAKRMQDYLGLTGPAAGFIPATALHETGATLRFADFHRPGVECEIAVRLARDLPPGPCDAARAADAVGELFAAIEVVENRYPDLPTFGTPSLIADQVFHAGAVIAPSGGDAWRSLDIPALAGTLSVDGTVRDRGVAADLLGHPFNSLAWLASSGVAAAFGGLRAGQVVLLGSVTPPLWLDAPGSVTVAFPPLAEVRVTLG